MAYDNDERDLDLDRQHELYEDDLYGADEFGERINTDNAYEEGLTDDETTAGNDALIDNSGAAPDADAAATSDADIEDGFGETITPASNPHLEDQLGDPDLSREAEADYPEAAAETKDDSLLDKAKDKINDWTGDGK